MPTSLPKECAKATQIFNSFASIIPPEILRSAKGFAILTIAKAGFLFSARAGTGLVIVKLANGGKSYAFCNPLPFGDLLAFPLIP